VNEVTAYQRASNHYIWIVDNVTVDRSNKLGDVMRERCRGWKLWYALKFDLRVFL